MAEETNPYAAFDEEESEASAAPAPRASEPIVRETAPQSFEIEAEPAPILPTTPEPHDEALNPYAAFDEDPGEETTDPAPVEGISALTEDQRQAAADESQAFEDYAGILDRARKSERIQALSQALSREATAKLDTIPAFSLDDPTTITDAQMLRESQPLPVGERETSPFDVIPGVRRGVGVAAEMIGSGLEFYSDGKSEVGKGLQSFGERQQRNAPDPLIDSWGKVGGVGDFWKYVLEHGGQGLGTSAPALGAGLAVGAVNPLAGFASMQGMTHLMGIGQMNDALKEEQQQQYLYAQRARDLGAGDVADQLEQQAKKLDPQNHKATVVLAGTAIGAVESIYETSLLAIGRKAADVPLAEQLKKGIKSYIIRRFAAESVKGTLTEGGEEVLQEAIQIIGVAKAKGLGAAAAFMEALDRKHKERYIESFAGGAAGGFALGTAATAKDIGKEYLTGQIADATKMAGKPRTGEDVKSLTQALLDADKASGSPLMKAAGQTAQPQTVPDFAAGLRAATEVETTQPPPAQQNITQKQRVAREAVTPVETDADGKEIPPKPQTNLTAEGESLIARARKGEALDLKPEALAEVAAENGIAVTPATLPEAIVEALEARRAEVMPLETEEAAEQLVLATGQLDNLRAQIDQVIALDGGAAAIAQRPQLYELADAIGAIDDTDNPAIKALLDSIGRAIRTKPGTQRRGSPAPAEPGVSSTPEARDFHRLVAASLVATRKIRRLNKAVRAPLRAKMREALQLPVQPQPLATENQAVPAPLAPSAIPGVEAAPQAAAPVAEAISPDVAPAEPRSGPLPAAFIDHLIGENSLSASALESLAATLGLGPSEMAGLLDQAQKEGWVRRDLRGRWRRGEKTFAARATSHEQTVEELVGKDIAEAVRAVAHQGPADAKLHLFADEKDLPANLREDVEAAKSVNPDAIIEGVTDPLTGDIWLSIYALDPTSVLREEAVHSLQIRGMMTAAETKILAAEAAKHPSLFDRALYEELYGEAKGAELEQLLDREAAAALIVARGNGQSFGTEVNSILDRILAFFERLANLLRHSQFATAEDLVQAFLSGDMATRQGRRSIFYGEVAHGELWSYPKAALEPTKQAIFAASIYTRRLRGPGAFGDRYTKKKAEGSLGQLRERLASLRDGSHWYLTHLREQGAAPEMVRAYRDKQINEVVDHIAAFEAFLPKFDLEVIPTQFARSQLMEFRGFVIRTATDRRHIDNTSWDHTLYVHKKPDKPLDEIKRPSRELGSPLGYVQLRRTDDGRWDVAMIEVKPKHRKSSAAAALLVKAQELVGMPLQPSGHLLPDGYKMLKRRFPFVAEWYRPHPLNPEWAWVSPKQLIAERDRLRTRLNETRTKEWRDMPWRDEDQREGYTQSLKEDLAKFEKVINELPAEAKLPERLQAMFSVNLKPLTKPGGDVSGASVTNIADIGPNDPHPGPVLAYHGTNAEFDRFDVTKSEDIGMHFGDVAQANDRTARLVKSRFDIGGQGENGRTIPVILDMKNVATVDDLRSWLPLQLAGELETVDPANFKNLGADVARLFYDLDNMTDDESADDYLAEEDRGPAYTYIRSRLDAAGYDGIRYNNAVEGTNRGQGFEDDNGWSYIAWKPGTVRSATSGERLLALDVSLTPLDRISADIVARYPKIPEGVRFEQSVEDPDMVVALLKGEKIGHLILARWTETDVFTADIEVDPQYQRRGIASAMTDFAEAMVGIELGQPEGMSEAGAAFQAARNLSRRTPPPGTQVNALSGFYSPLIRTLETSKRKKGNAQAWLNELRQVPKDELQWTNLINWLGEQQGEIAKEAIMAYVDDRQVDVIVTVLGEDKRMVTETYYEDAPDEEIDEDNEEADEPEFTEEQLEEQAREGAWEDVAEWESNRRAELTDLDIEEDAQPRYMDFHVDAEPIILEFLRRNGVEQSVLTQAEGESFDDVLERVNDETETRFHEGSTDAEETDPGYYIEAPNGNIIVLPQNSEEQRRNIAEHVRDLERQHQSQDPAEFQLTPPAESEEASGFPALPWTIFDSMDRATRNTRDEASEENDRTVEYESEGNFDGYYDDRLRDLRREYGYDSRERARPRIRKERTIEKLAPVKWENYVPEGTAPGTYREAVFTVKGLQFEGGHFAHHLGGMNEFMHLRFDEVKGPKGEKLLRWVEAQSDLHRQAGERGYLTPEAQANYQAAYDHYLALDTQRREARDKFLQAIRETQAALYPTNDRGKSNDALWEEWAAVSNKKFEYLSAVKEKEGGASFEARMKALAAATPTGQRTPGEVDGASRRGWFADVSRIFGDTNYYGFENELRQMARAADPELDRLLKEEEALEARRRATGDSYDILSHLLDYAHPPAYPEEFLVALNARFEGGVEKLRKLGADVEAAQTAADRVRPSNLVPNAPFKGERWWELQAKWFLQYAVAKGYDGITWSRFPQIAHKVGNAPEKMYEEKIPGFYKKYGKQWGAAVNYINWMQSGDMVQRERVSSLVGAFARQEQKRNSERREKGITDLRFTDEEMQLLSRAAENVKNSAYNDDAYAQAISLNIDPLEGKLREIWDQMVAKVEGSKENGVLTITPEMRAAIANGQSLFAQSEGAAREAIVERLRRNVKQAPIRVEHSVMQEVFRAAEMTQHVLPKGVGVYTLARAEPLDDADPSMMRITFEDASGDQIVFDQSANLLVGSRAFFDLFTGNVLVIRHGTFPGLVDTVAGEIYHEATHGRRMGFGGARIDGSDWSRLVAHAKSLGVLKMQLGPYLQTIGAPNNPALGNWHVAIEKQYREHYAEIFTPQEIEEYIDQEAAAHFNELRYHRYWSPAQLAPVKDILDRHFPLRSRTPQALAALAQSPEIQPELDAQGFFSPSLEAVKRLPQERGTVEQMKAMLIAAGAQPKELAAIGFDAAFPDPQAQITRADIEQYLRDNRVQLGEKVSNPNPTLFRIWDRDGDPVFDGTRAEAERELANYPGGRITEEMDNDGLTGRYESYSTPGGIPGSYREVVTTLPEKIPQPKSQSLTRAEFDEMGALTQKMRRDGNLQGEELARYRDLNDRNMTYQRELDAEHERLGKNDGNYTSSHWPGITNPLLHRRFKLFDNGDGTQTLVWDETQSDWAQSLRDYGARDPVAAEQLSRQKRLADDRLAVAGYNLREALGKLPAEVRDTVPGHVWNTAPGPASWLLRAPDSVLSEEQRSALNGLHIEYNLAHNEVLDLSRRLGAAQTGVPDAPFISNTSDWVDLAIRQTLLEIARDPSLAKVTKMAWTPGSVQIDRYPGIELVATSVTVSREENGQRDYQFWDADDKSIAFLVTDSNGTIISSDTRSVRKGTNIADIVGSDHVASRGTYDVDVTFGDGGGMRAFYGDFAEDGRYTLGIFGTRLLKTVRALDPNARIEKSFSPDLVVDKFGDKWKVLGSEVYQEFETRAEADAYAASIAGTPKAHSYPSIHITPALRAAIQRGLPLFGSIKNRKPKSPQAMFSMRLRNRLRDALPFRDRYKAWALSRRFAHEPSEVSGMQFDGRPGVRSVAARNIFPQTGTFSPSATPTANANPAPGYEESVERQQVRTRPSALRLLPDFASPERFFDLEVEASDGASLTATTAYEAYAAWAEDNAVIPVSLPEFQQAMADLGIMRARIAGRVRYIGLKLRRNPDAETQPLFAVSVPNVTPQPQGISRIIAMLADAVGAPIRSGRLSRVPGARATSEYKDSGVIRTRDVDNIHQAAQAAALRLEVTLAPYLSQLEAQHSGELMNLANEVGGMSERAGFKHFFDLYVSSYLGRYAYTKAPGFYDAFEELLDRTDPRMLAELQATQQAYATYVSSEAQQRLAVDIVRVEPHPSYFGGVMARTRRHIERLDKKRGKALGFVWQAIRLMMSDGYRSFVSRNFAGHQLQKLALEKREASTAMGGTPLDRINARMFEMNMTADMLATATHQPIDTINAMLQGALPIAGDLRDGVAVAIDRTPNWVSYGRERVTLPAGEDLYTHMKSSGNIRAWVENALMYGFSSRTVNGDGTVKRLGPGYLEVIAAAMDGKGTRFRYDDQMLKDFDSFLVARRAAFTLYPRFRQGLIPHAPVRESEAAVTSAYNRLLTKHPHFADAAKLWDAFNKSWLTSALEWELISQQQYDTLIQDPNYAPFSRQMTADEIAGVHSEMLQGGPNNATPLLKRLLGSDRNIISPTAVILARVQTLLQRSYQQQFAFLLEGLVDLAPGMGMLVEKIPATDIRVQKLNAHDALRQVVKAAGLEMDDVQVLLDAMADVAGDPRTLEINAITQRPTMPRPGETLIPYFKDGKLNYLSLYGTAESPHLAADLFANFAMAGQEAMPFWLDFMRNFAQWRRLTITSWPGFILRNLVQDPIVHATLFHWNNIPGKTHISGFKSWLKGDEFYKAYTSRLAQSGILGGAMSAEARRGLNEQSVERLVGKRTGWREKLRAFFEIFGRVSEASETFGRLGLFKAAYKRALKQGLTQLEAWQEAGAVATDVMNYNEFGHLIGAIRSISPFTGAGIVGVDKGVRTAIGQSQRGSAVKNYFAAMRTNGLRGAYDSLSKNEQEAVKGAAGLALKTIFVFGALELILWALFHDDDEWRDQPDDVHATHWVIPMSDDLVSSLPQEMQGFYKDGMLRIPKAFELAIPANLIHLTLDIRAREQGGRKAAERYAASILHTITPPLSFPIAGDILALENNRNPFSGTPITNQWLAKKDPEDQFTPYTSSLGKALGEQLKIAPTSVDFLIKSALGPWGRDLLVLTDRLDPNRPAMRLSETPLGVSRFFTQMGKGSKTLDDYMETVNPPLQWNINNVIRMVGGHIQAYEPAKLRYRDALEDRGRLDEANAELDKMDVQERTYAMMSVLWKGDKSATAEKRLHPLIRQTELAKVLTDVARDTMENDLAPDLTKAQKQMGVKRTPVKLTSTQQRDIIRLAKRITINEAGNALILMRRPGYENGQPVDVAPLYQELAAAAPEAWPEIKRRLDKAHILPFAAVAKVWPDVERVMSNPATKKRLTDSVSPIVKGVLTVPYLKAKAEAARSRVRTPSKVELPGMMRLGGPEETGEPVSGELADVLDAPFMADGTTLGGGPTPDLGDGDGLTPTGERLQ